MRVDKKILQKPLCGMVILSVLSACSGSDSETVESPAQITVAPSIAPSSMTRTYSDSTGTYFSEGDAVSIYAWTGMDTHVDLLNMVVNGVLNTLGKDGRWTSSPQMLWGDMVTPHYFLGICPPRSVTDFYTDRFSITPGDEEASDLLVGMNTEGIVATGEPIGIVFDHLMAMLQVNLAFKTEWASTPTDVSVGCTAATSCAVNYNRKKVVLTEGSEPVELPQTATASGYARSHRGVMVPQSGLTAITVAVEGRHFTYNHPRDIPLKSGSVTTVNLTLGRDTVELSGVYIDNWEETTPLDGTGVHVGAR